MRPPYYKDTRSHAPVGELSGHRSAERADAFDFQFHHVAAAYRKLQSQGKRDDVARQDDVAAGQALDGVLEPGTELTGMCLPEQLTVDANPYRQVVGVADLVGCHQARTLG